MTVASMPMVSDVVRSIPCASPVVPRQMLPPPTTMASSRSSSALRRGDLAGEALDHGGVDGLVGRRRGQGLTRHLEHDPAPAKHVPSAARCIADVIGATASLPAT